MAAVVGLLVAAAVAPARPAVAAAEVLTAPPEAASPEAAGPTRLACLPAAVGTATVAAVVDGDAVVLDDGRTVRLAGIAAPRPALGGEPAPAEDIEHDRPEVPAEFRPGPERPAASAAVGGDHVAAARRFVAGRVLGRTVAVHPVAARPDRHGRVVADLVTEDGGSLAALLVAAGLARVVPAPGEASCARPLLALEAAARAARAGMWADPGFAVLSAGDPDLARRAGRYALVEGLVRSTGRAGPRHYLNFGRDFRSDFTAVIDDNEIGRFTRAGFAPERLRGRAVRLRGWLAAEDGGLMRLKVPEEIEWVR